MCGIFCLFLNRPLTEADIALGRAGTRALAHRGPDGEGEWVDKASGVFLGHRRLAIIDPSPGSNQPLDLNGTVLSYNGEIYNFKELRERLRQNGHSFRTTGDVEVLAWAWKTWGEKALEWLDGMFAFVIWDGAQGHIVTDPFGEKPLYFAETRDGLYVSSEIAPLAHLLGLEPSMHGEALVAYLSLGFIPPPATAYTAIHRLGAAKLLTVTRGRIESTRSYWTAPVAPPGSGPARPLGEKDLDDLQGVLADSVKGRLYADVPLCMFLSQGIDSALVAAIAKQDHGADLKCLTVSYPDSGLQDEAPGASKIAKYIGAEHEIISVGLGPESIDPSKVIEIFGQPNESTTALSIFKMSAAAVANNYRTGLTGTGGDEVFFGYGKNSFFYRRRMFYGLPQGFRQALAVLVRPFTQKNPRLMRLAFDVLAADAEQYLANKNFPAISWLRQLDGFLPWSRTSFGGKGHLAYALAKIEFELILPGSRLVTFDHSSMAAGLELRTPFLSRKLVETVAKFDPRAFLAFGQKSVLRRMLGRYLPDHLFQYPKTGFLFPQAMMLDQLSNLPTQISGVPSNLMADVFRRSNEGGGWESLAVRLVSLDAFLRKDKNLRPGT